MNANLLFRYFFRQSIMRDVVYNYAPSRQVHSKLYVKSLTLSLLTNNLDNIMPAENKLDTMPPQRIRKVIGKDIPFLARVLAPSFAAQPLTKWILGEGEKGIRKGVRVLELDFRNALRYDLMFTTEDLQGAALWHPPERRESTRENFIWFLRLLRIIGLSRNLFAQINAFRTFEELFPREPNYYLAMLAVAPAFQGRGIGSALLKPVLEMCDARCIPAYAVTDTATNVRFYEKLGFRARDSFPIPKAGVTAWTLWRAPKEISTEA